ncbi:MAG: TraX family protein [Candidatus Scatovivens sp.]
MLFQIQNGIITLYFGRISFPLFAFIAVEGYLHTSDLKKYIKRLIIFGIISQIPFMLFRTLVSPGVHINIMFTLLLGILSICSIDKIKNKYFGSLIAILLIALGQVVKVDYGWFGVGLVLLIYLTKKNRVIFFTTYSIYVLLYYFITYIKMNFSLINFCLPYILMSVLPIFLMMSYNGKLGKKIKYFYYWFYPIHMIVLYGISKFI